MQTLNAGASTIRKFRVYIGSRPYTRNPKVIQGLGLRVQGPGLKRHEPRILTPIFRINPLLPIGARCSKVKASHGSLGRFTCCGVQGLPVWYRSLNNYPQAPKQFLFGITLQNSKHEPQKGTTLGPMGNNCYAVFGKVNLQSEDARNTITKNFGFYISVQGLEVERFRVQGVGVDLNPNNLAQFQR